MSKWGSCKYKLNLVYGPEKIKFFKNALIMKQKNKKPKAYLLEADGLRHRVIIASVALRKVGEEVKARDLEERCYKSDSFEEVLNIIMEYVEPV